jgi:hypothetical protein
MNKVRPIEKEDYRALARFLEKKTEGVDAALLMDRFTCWWDENPAMCEGVDRGWILYEDDGKVGGTFGNIPVRYFIHGQEKIVCSASTWYMSKKSSRRALELFHLFLTQKHPLLNTGSTEKVVQISLQMGFKQLNQPWLREGAIYINDVPSFWYYISHKFSHHKLKLFLLQCAGIFIVPLLKIINAINRKRLAALDKGYTIKKIQAFDQKYTALSNKLKEKYDILAVRDHIALNWFFFGSEKLRSSRRVVEIKNKENLIGYIGVKEGEKRQGAKTYNYIEVVDLVLIEESEPAYNALIHGLLRIGASKDKNIAYIKTHILNHELRKSLKRSGFFTRPAGENFLYRNFAEPDLDKNFYASPLDGDRPFFP